MTKKGIIAEILSRAMHHDDPGAYSVGYLDFGAVKEVKLQEFLKLSEGFEVIPASRIHYIKKGNEILYSRKVDKKISM